MSTAILSYKYRLYYIKNISCELLSRCGCFCACCGCPHSCSLSQVCAALVSVCARALHTCPPARTCAPALVLLVNSCGCVIAMAIDMCSPCYVLVLSLGNGLGTYSNREHRLEVGNTMVLECHIDSCISESNPPMEIVWSGPALDDLSSEQREGVVRKRRLGCSLYSSLVIVLRDSMDSGVYSCSYDGLAQSLQFNVTVWGTFNASVFCLVSECVFMISCSVQLSTESPSFDDDVETEYTVHEGGSIAIDCVILKCYEDNPECTTEWERQPSSGVAITRNHSETTTTLSLTNVGQQDEGYYSCLFHTPVHHSMSKIFHVTVTRANPSAPWFNTSVEHTDIVVTYSDPLVLRCPVIGGDAPISIAWTYTDSLGQAQRNFSDVLRIEDHYMGGIYTCTATNDHGSSKLDIFVKIHGE